MDEQEAMIKLFNRLGTIVSSAELTTPAVRAVLVKLTLLTSINAVTKDEFMHQMSHAWDIEKLFQPDPSEIH
jgi:hypothetical protein